MGGWPSPCSGLYSKQPLVLVRGDGARLLAGLQGISSAQVREVRGLGLMVAVEVKGKSAPYLAVLAERGVLALSAGANVIRFLPPLVISAEEVDEVVAQVAAVLEAQRG